MLIVRAVELFLRDRTLAGLAASSIQQYTVTLHSFTKWLAGRDCIHTSQLSRDAIVSYLAYRKLKHSQSTVCHDRSLIYCLLKWMRSYELTQIDPATLPRVPPPRQDEIRRVFVTPQQAQRLFTMLRRAYREERRAGGSGYFELRNLCVAALLFGAGLRIGEVAAIEVQHIDFVGREVYLPHTKSSVPRYAVLPASVRAVVRAFLRLRQQTHVKSRWLFASPYSGHSASKTLAHAIQKQAAREGITITSHTGRRYCITQIAERSVLAAQQQAGHAFLSTTQQYVRQSRAALHRVIGEYDPLR